MTAGSMRHLQRVDRLHRQHHGHEIERPLRDSEPADAAEQREQARLAQQLPDQLPAPGADRQPDRHLACRVRRRAPAAGWRCWRRRSAARTPVTPSSSASGALRFAVTLLWPRLPASSTIGFALNRAIVCGLMPFCSGASTSLMIARYGRCHRRPRLLDRHARLQPREQVGPVVAAVVECLRGCEKPRIVIGTNTSGFTPSVVPSKPCGATPTIVIVWPLTISGWFEDAGIDAESASASMRSRGRRRATRPARGRRPA